MTTEFGHLTEDELREHAKRYHEIQELDGYDDHDWRTLIAELPGLEDHVDLVSELMFVLGPYARASDGDTLTEPAGFHGRVQAALAHASAPSWAYDRLTYACALAGWRQAQLELAALWARLAAECRELALEVCRRVPARSPTPQLVARLEYRSSQAAIQAVGWTAVAAGRRAVNWDQPVPFCVHARTIGTEISATLWRKPDPVTEEEGKDPDPVPATPRANTSVVVVERVAGAGTYGKDIARGLKDIAGRDVPLALGLSVTGIAEVRRELVGAWPYASGVVDALLSDVVPGRGVRLRPTLLVGPPGSGKSRLLRTVVSTLGLPLSTLDGGTCADQAVVGSPRRWRDSYPSMPFTAILQSGIGNPALLVDEIEKAGTSSAGSIHAALLGLLERDTARSWRDQYLDAQVDVSWCSWLFTANSVSGLPAALLGRLRVLRMPSPRVGDVPVLARTLLHELLAERLVDRCLEPNLDVVELEAVSSAFAASRSASLRDLRRIVEAALDARGMAPKH